MRDVFVLRDKPQMAKVLILIATVVVAYLISLMCARGLNTFQFAIASSVIIVGLSYLMWEKAVLFLAIWAIIAGAVRKWFLPEQSDIVFFFTHIMLIGIYLHFFGYKILSRTFILPKHPINIFFVVYIIWGVICAFNPNLKDIKIGLVGLVIYFFYLPLCLVVPYVFPSKEYLIKVFKIFSILSIPLLILGTIQFFSPFNSPINKYVGDGVENVAIATVGDFPRITSTFSYISGYSAYLNILVLIMIYLLSLRTLSQRFTIILYFLIAFAIANMFMTGSRGPLIFTIISSFIYAFICGVISYETIKKVLPRFIAVIVILVTLITFTPLKHAYEAFMERYLSSQSETKERLTRPYIRPFLAMKEAGFYGFGIGTTYQGAQAIRVAPLILERRKLFTNYEEETARLVLDIGACGFILSFLIRFFILWYFWKLSTTLKNIDLRYLAILCFIFQFQFFIGLNNLVFNHTTHLFYWFSTGFLFLLTKIDKEETKEKVKVYGKI